MSYLIAATMRRLWAPRHEISCSTWVWRNLIETLRERGRRGSHESGAFLLGYRAVGCARVRGFIPYDDLDPHSLDTGIVRFDGRYYGALWDQCRRDSLAVVADVHTHPGGSQQSESDRAHPMIASSGHLALILPRFAMPPLRHEEIGMYRYLGARRWYAVPMSRRQSFLHIGL